jgi:hypothetical protein
LGEFALFGIAKQKVTEAFAAASFVHGLLADLEEAYPSVLKQLKLMGAGGKGYSFPDNLKEIVSDHIFALEVITLRNFFNEDQARRLRRLCTERLAAKTGRTVEGMLLEVIRYERLYDQYANDAEKAIVGVTRLLCGKLRLAEPESSLDSGPDMNIILTLRQVFAELIGRWERLNRHSKIVEG